MRQLTALAMALPLTLLSIGVAHADSNDDDFIQKVSGAAQGAPADVIRIAHEICQSLDSGQNVDDVLDGIVTQLHFSVKNAAMLQAQSVTHYCPKYASVPFQRAH